MFANYTLKNAHGMEISLSELGAAWTSCRLPLSNGEIREVLLAGQNIEKTLREGGSYAGAIIGRYAGRIAGAKYDNFSLTANLPPHCLHGGKLGFSRRSWDALETQSPPDSPTRHPEWGILKTGEIYQQKTVYAFNFG